MLKSENNELWDNHFENVIKVLFEMLKEEDMEVKE